MTPRRVTITDVASATGFSISTVSAALNGTSGVSAGNRERIIRTATELGYAPDARASRLRRRRSGLLGVTFTEGQGFHGDLLDGLYAAAREAGYDAMLAASTPHHAEPDCIATLLDNRCEGLVLIGTSMTPARLERLAARLPVVVVTHDSLVPGADVVDADDAAGVDTLVAHLVERGHRRLVHIDGGTSSRATARREAFLAAVRSRGLDSSCGVETGGWDEESGADAARRLLDAGPLPDAVLAFNDHVGVGVIATFSRAGIRVPQDVAVCGFDGIPLAAVSAFGLTTMVQDTAAMSATAVAAILDRLDGGLRTDLVPGVVTTTQGTARHSTVEPALQVRSST